MMTAMAASSFPSLEADDDCGECLLAFAAPCMICSESESAWPELPFPPREVVAAVRLGPAVFLLAKEVSVCQYVSMSVCQCFLLPVHNHPAQLAPVLLHLGHGGGEAQSVGL